MGLCQGQTCGGMVRQIVAKELQTPPDTLEPATARAPMRPVEMWVLAREGGEEDA